MAKNITPIKAIRKRCIDCFPENTFNEIRNCENENCWLWNYRLGKRPNIKNLTPVKAIKNYCLKFCCLDQRNKVDLCPDNNCSLYKFRKGKNPNIKNRSRKIKNIPII